MKKIISLLSVFAMIATLFTTVAFAADNEVVFNQVNKTANSVDIEVSLKTTYNDIKTIKLYLNMSDATTKGATIEVANGDATLNYVAAQKMVNIVFAPTDAHMYANGTVLGTIKITNISEDFAISLAAKTSRTTSLVTSVAGGDLMYGSTVAFDPAAIATSVTMVEKPAEPELVENPYVFSFDADEETEVKITNSRTGDRTYSLPSFVKGASKVNALLKIKDGSDVKTGDKFTIDAIKGDVARTITTIEVK